jgi:hypothetical protein
VKWGNQETGILLCYKFSSIGTLSCVAKRGLVAPTLAEEDGVPIVLDSWMLGKGNFRGNSRIAYVLGGSVVFVEPKF